MKLIWLLLVPAITSSAESLPAVSPPTDWTGVAVVVGLGLAIFLPIIYAVYVKLKAGQQWGEETIERVAIRVSEMMKPSPPAAVEAVLVTWPMTMDGRTFNTEAELAEYKAAKAVMDKYKGTTP